MSDKRPPAPPPPDPPAPIPAPSPAPAAPAAAAPVAPKALKGIFSGGVDEDDIPFAELIQRLAQAPVGKPLPEQRMDEVWQGEDVEEGVGAEEDQAATLAHAEQVRAAQQLIEEQVGQLVRLTRSRTKAATQAAPSARASSSRSSSSEESEEDSSSSSDSG